MALVVEDGTGVANANTYVDLAYLVAYATDRNYTLPTTDAERESFLLRAMDYIESFRSQFKGSKSVDAQALQWPRQDVLIDNVAVGIAVIPAELKKAQCQLVVEQQLRTPLFPRPITSTIEGIVTEKKIGPISKKYSSNSRSHNVLANPNQPIKIASVEVFLRPLLLSSVCGGNKLTYRV